MKRQSGSLTWARSPRRWLFLLLFGLVLGVAGCGQSSDSTSATALAAESDAVPDAELALLGGGTIRLADLAGKVVVLEFWATWCLPCRRQAEILEELYPEYRDHGVEFLAVDSAESEEVVRNFVEDHPFSYPVVLDLHDKWAIDLELVGLPTTVIIDREGRVVFKETGIATAQELREELAKAGVAVS